MPTVGSGGYWNTFSLQLQTSYIDRDNSHRNSPDTPVRPPVEIPIGAGMRPLSEREKYLKGFNR